MKTHHVKCTLHQTLPLRDARRPEKQSLAQATPYRTRTDIAKTLNRQVFSIRFTVRMAFRKEMEIQGLEPWTFRL